jgi:hypothetical protein
MESLLFSPHAIFVVQCSRFRQAITARRLSHLRATATTLQTSWNETKKEAAPSSGYGIVLCADLTLGRVDREKEACLDGRWESGVVHRHHSDLCGPNECLARVSVHMRKGSPTDDDRTYRRAPTHLGRRSSSVIMQPRPLSLDSC